MNVKFGLLHYLYCWVSLYVLGHKCVNYMGVLVDKDTLKCCNGKFSLCLRDTDLVEQSLVIRTLGMDSSIASMFSGCYMTVNDALFEASSPEELIEHIVSNTELTEEDCFVFRVKLLKFIATIVIASMLGLYVLPSPVYCGLFVVLSIFHFYGNRSTLRFLLVTIALMIFLVSTLYSVGVVVLVCFLMLAVFSALHI